MPSLAPFRPLVLPMWTMLSPKSDQNNHMTAAVKIARQQTTPELSGTFRTLPPGTYANTRRNSPEPSETFRNLPPEPTPACPGTLRNSPEPSGTCLQNLNQHANRNPPEPSETLLPEPTPAHARTFEIFPNLPELRNPPPPEPTPAHTGTLQTFRNLPPQIHQHGTLRNLPPELAPVTRTGTHRSLSGLKTPLAYAVGEKLVFILCHSFFVSLVFFSPSSCLSVKTTRSPSSACEKQFHPPTHVPLMGAKARCASETCETQLRSTC